MTKNRTRRLENANSHRVVLRFPIDIMRSIQDSRLCDHDGMGTTFTHTLCLELSTQSGRRVTRLPEAFGTSSYQIVIGGECPAKHSVISFGLPCHSTERVVMNAH